MASSSSLSSSSSLAYSPPISTAPLTSLTSTRSLVISEKSIETLNSNQKNNECRIFGAKFWKTEMRVKAVSVETPIPAVFKDYIAKSKIPVDLIFIPATVNGEAITPKLLEKLAIARGPKLTIKSLNKRLSKSEITSALIESQLKDMKNVVYMDPKISEATHAHYLESTGIPKEIVVDEEVMNSPELVKKLAFAPFEPSIGREAYVDEMAALAYELEPSKTGVPRSIEVVAPYWIAMHRELSFKGQEPDDQAWGIYYSNFVSKFSLRRPKIIEACVAALFAQVLKEALFGEYNTFTRVEECLGSTFLRSCVGSNHTGLLEAHGSGVSFAKVGCALTFQPTEQDGRSEETKERLPEESKSSS